MWVLIVSSEDEMQRSHLLSFYDLRIKCCDSEVLRWCIDDLPLALVSRLMQRHYYIPYQLRFFSSSFPFINLNDLYGSQAKSKTESLTRGYVWRTHEPRHCSIVRSRGAVDKSRDDFFPDAQVLRAGRRAGSRSGLKSSPPRFFEAAGFALSISCRLIDEKTSE